MRYADKPSDIVEELDKADENDVVLFHELIKEMPGEVALLTHLSFTGKHADVAAEALFRCKAEDLSDDEGVNLLLDGIYPSVHKE